MAINSNFFGGPTNSSWACNPLWDCGEKEMGCELCFHGPLRLRRSPNLLGPWAHHMSFGAKSKYGNFPMADYVCFQFAFAAITVVLLAGSLFGRMNFYAWMFFVPLRLTFCYANGAFTIWGSGFLQPYIIDYAGGFVVHLSSGVAGFTAAYWVIN